ARLSERGVAGVTALMKDLVPEIRYTFLSRAGLSYEQKVGNIHSMLRKARAKMDPSWFLAEGDDLVKVAQGINKELTMGKGGGFLPYLENYLPRLLESETNLRLMNFEKIGGKYAPFYSKRRVLAEASGKRLDLEGLVHARIRAQGKEMFFYDKLSEAAEYASKLGLQWRNLTEHYAARVLGMPSMWDEHVAKLIEPTLGRVIRAFGGEGVWDAQRVMRLSKNVNDFTHMGFLGLKPFSAMRNMFQPLLNVPADLGGTKDIGHLIKGFGRGFSPQGRRELRAMGIITDYVPEQMHAPKIWEFRKLGFLPTRNEWRDVSMWMFRGSDRFNRYVTGGAALSKWEGAARKYGLDTMRGSDFLKISERRLQGFMQKAGVNGRHSWVRTEIENALRVGRKDEAKAIFVRDVVADTQYLYGALDAPLITQTGGALTRTAAIFQSWWMNYGTLLGKWATTGTIDARARKAIAFTLYGAISMRIMEQVWGTRTAVKSTLLGPFPSPDQMMLPPSWDPIWQTIKTAWTAYEVAVGAKDFEDVGKQVKALLSSTYSFTPGALQVKQLYRGARKEGTPGFLKAIVKYQPPEED
ncbi:MAG: hypothetical protein NWE76_10700, partial [Candidatus Bathyarchaeota archaeon]|nr:hypothetical protein [Candidatus Bathyarchaeota archaeon]